ncbi:hypothetical protein DAEQUDRAFT_459094 [Daedalea quercina L-15889]|uniref:F-box domain-containing protein n=1 Tax=Daedalea quercina L-15889 TaxID=1314783 RepID=A0A165TC59_9APHY|nr:hypothetical protein DAEQUDRAFT_459094 [Daedalea quercina L-15889]
MPRGFPTSKARTRLEVGVARLKATIQRTVQRRFLPNSQYPQCHDTPIQVDASSAFEANGEIDDQRMLPELPVEIWERIIDHLWIYPECLQRCALVCKAWNARSRFHLVSAINLRDSRSAYRLATLLTHHPQLAGRVKRVGIWGAPMRETPGPIPHLGTFTLMLAKKLAAVETLAISAAEWQSRTMHPDIFLHLSTTINVVNLWLYRVTFLSKITFARLICALPNLRTISCVDVTIHSTESVLSAFPSRRARIKEIKLGGPSDDVVGLITQCLRLAGGVEVIRTGYKLSKTRNAASKHAISSLIEHAGPALKVLDIQLSRPLWLVAEKDKNKFYSEVTALRLCTRLEMLLISYRPLSPKKYGLWLEKLILGVNAETFRILHLVVDLRHIHRSDASELIKIAQGFLEDQSSRFIDERLAHANRFRNLELVSVHLHCSCSPQVISPDVDSWRAAMAVAFPQLHKHSKLQGKVMISLDTPPASHNGTPVNEHTAPVQPNWLLPRIVGRHAESSQVVEPN